ncbi:MAG TPA: hypothetical protein VKU38_23380 [Ktedonobacteraceae bacterium]|nr:hypothetical protein [Ktedonobacteraceae bacterium]
MADWHMVGLAHCCGSCQAGALKRTPTTMRRLVSGGCAEADPYNNAAARARRVR